MKTKRPAATALRTAITDAARLAFTELRDAHPKETFYTYALYTSSDAGYIIASANTEEGLRRRAVKSKGKGKKGLEEEMRSLRWNAPDWDFHGVGERHFEKAEELLNERPSIDDLDEDAWERESALRMAIFVEALQALDKEGVFGRGKSREKLTLLLTMGDQETKFLLQCARQLNPAKVYDQFSKPFLRVDAGRFKGLGSRKVYETNGVAVARNGKVFATAGDGFLLAFSWPSRKEILKVRLEFNLSAQAVSVSPDGGAVALGWGVLDGEEGGIRVWDVKSRKVLWNVKGQKDAVDTIDFSPDGETIASGSIDGTLAWWDARRGKLIRKSKPHKDGIECVRFSPAGNLLASLDRSEGVRLWEASSGKPLGRIAERGDRLAFSPQGQWLAIASGYAKKDPGLSLWDVAHKKLVKRLEAVTKSRFRVVQGPDDHEDCQASGVAFSDDGKLLAVERSWPGSVVLWNWQEAKELGWMNPNYESLSGVAFLPDGKTVAVAGRSMDGPPLLLWDISEEVRK